MHELVIDTRRALAAGNLLITVSRAYIASMSTCFDSFETRHLSIHTSISK
jgi:hypothetical protein